MHHAFVDIGDKTMCSRCGKEVFRVDEQCPSISDGEMYKRGIESLRAGNAAAREVFTEEKCPVDPRIAAARAKQ